MIAKTTYPESLFFVFFQKHACPQCSERLERSYTSETVTRRSLTGRTKKVELRTGCFYCTRCRKQLSFKEVRAAEDAINIEKEIERRRKEREKNGGDPVWGVPTVKRYDGGLYFSFIQKHYCPECGERLQRSFIDEILPKESEEAKQYVMRRNRPIPAQDIELQTACFYCGQCDKKLSFQEVRAVEKERKRRREKREREIARDQKKRKNT